MIDSIKVFRMVVNKQGFRAAATELGLSPAMVSRHITKLEHHLKTVLLKRNTRSITLTDSGVVFYHHSKTLLNLYDQCLNQISNVSQPLSGNLKIGLPHSISQHYVIPALPDFYAAHPNMTLDIIAGNHSLELFSHGYDLALHCGPLPDSSLYYTLIGHWRKYTVAAPNYLDNHGTPTHPEQLAHHQCLVHFDNRARTWRYHINQQSIDIPVFGRGRINNSLDLCQMACCGLGIAYLPEFTVNQAIHQHQLTPILTDYMPPPLPMYMVHINPRPSQREQVFIDFIRTLNLTSPTAVS